MCKCPCNCDMEERTSQLAQSILILVGGARCHVDHSISAVRYIAFTSFGCLSPEMPEVSTRIIEIPIPLDNLTKLLPKNEPQVEYEVNTAAIVISFLAIVLLICVFANSLLVVSVLSSRTLRKVNLYVILSNVGVLNIFASLSHISLSMFFVSQDGDWLHFGHTSLFLCKLHTFLIQVVTCETMLTVAHLCADRLLALTRSSEYRKRINSKKQTIAIVTTWIVSFMSSLPILTLPDTLIQTAIYPRRYACFLSSKSHVFYCLFALVVLLLLPVTFVALAIAYVILRIVGDSKKFKSMKSKSSYSEFLLKQPHFWNELQMSQLIPVIGIAFLLLYLPFMCTQQHTIFHHSDGYGKVMYPKSIENGTSPTDILVLDTVNTLESDYFFTWMHFLYYIFVPLAVIYFRTDIRKKLYDYLYCWKNNAVSDGGMQQPAYSIQEMPKPSVILKPKKDSFQTATRKNTPVLFATPEGLHLRTIDSSGGGGESQQESSNLDASIQSNWSVKPKYVSKLCDIVCSDEDDHLLGDRTEDPNPSGVEDSAPAKTPKEIKVKSPPLKLKTSLVTRGERKKGSKKSVRFADEIMEILPESPGGSHKSNKRIVMSKSSSSTKTPNRRSGDENKNSKRNIYNLLPTSKNKQKTKSYDGSRRKDESSFYVLN